MTAASLLYVLHALSWAVICGCCTCSSIKIDRGLHSMCLCGFIILVHAATFLFFLTKKRFKKKAVVANEEKDLSQALAAEHTFPI